MYGTSGNKDAGIDHIYLTGQSSKEEQAHFKRIQRERLRKNNIVLAVKLLLVLAFIGGILFSQIDKNEMDKHKIVNHESAELIIQTVEHINSGNYEKALISADLATETGRNAWHGHFYKGVAFFHLGDFKAAKDEMEKMASIYNTSDAIPSTYLPMYLFTRDGKFVDRENKKNQYYVIRYGLNSITPYFFEDRKLCYPPTVPFSLDYKQKIKNGRPTCFSNELIEKAIESLSKKEIFYH